ncbi:MAG: 4Fe-4S binding protein [Acidobacteria bacterium]|nr:4Fe-4S binding protein [Acidobacteriota bacterium]
MPRVLLRWKSFRLAALVLGSTIALRAVPMQQHDHGAAQDQHDHQAHDHGEAAVPGGQTPSKLDHVDLASLVPAFFPFSSFQELRELPLGGPALEQFLKLENAQVALQTPLRYAVALSQERLPIGRIYLAERQTGAERAPLALGVDATGSLTVLSLWEKTGGDGTLAGEAEDLAADPSLRCLAMALAAVSQLNESVPFSSTPQWVYKETQRSCLLLAFPVPLQEGSPLWIASASEEIIPEERVEISRGPGTPLFPARRFGPGAFGFRSVPFPAGLGFQVHLSRGTETGTVSVNESALALPERHMLPGGARNFGVILGVLLGVTGLFFAVVRSWGPRARRAAAGFDLLSIAWFRRFFTWRHFQLALQLPNLLVFALVVYLGFFDVQDSRRNLATVLTWTIWWAAVIFTFVLVGRFWCTMCPFGAITAWANRAAKPLRRVPRGFRNIWIANLSFVALTWLDAHLGIVGSPRATAILVLAVTAAAVLVGVLFERLSFCRHFCPIGGLTGLYSMFSPLELRVKDSEVCRNCQEKSCYRGNELGRGCPMGEFPGNMARNNYCVLCSECVKCCREDNLELRVRPLAQDLWSQAHPRVDEAYLAVALVALTLVVTGHMVAPWHEWMAQVGEWFPFFHWGASTHGGQEKAVFGSVYFISILIVTPLLVYLGVRLARKMALAELRPRDIFALFGYMFIPVGLSMHLAHNLYHLFAEGSRIVPVVQRAFQKYLPVSLGNPRWDLGTILTADTIFGLQVFVCVAAYLIALWAGHRIALRSAGSNRPAFRALLPMAALALAFTLLNLYVLSQPMSMRHVH